MPERLYRAICYFFPLLLALLMSAPAQAEKESADGKVLTMTGLKRDSVKTVTESMKFYGLRRHNPGMPPPSSEKNNK